MFSAQTGVSYLKFKTLFNTVSDMLPDKFENSIYKRVNATQRHIKLTNDRLITSQLIQMHMFYYWSKSKEIYQFDKDFAEELEQTPVDTIPYENLKLLPYDTFAITINNDYILVHKCYDSNHTESDYLIIGKFNHELQYVNMLGLPLTEEFSTVDSLRNICETPSQVDDVINCLNLIMYLTSEKSDIKPNPEQKTVTRRSGQVKNVYREIRKWNVGYRFGAAFRKEKQSVRTHTVTSYDSVHTGTKKRPHIRRAHWHKFWTGKKDSDERRLVLKWLSPVAINMDDEDDTPAVIHDIQK